MPYKLVRSKNGKYFVVTKRSGKRHSKRPLSKEMAIRQMRALYAVENGYRLRNRSKRK